MAGIFQEKKLPQSCGRSEEVGFRQLLFAWTERRTWPSPFSAQVNNRVLPGKYLCGGEKVKTFFSQV